MEPSEDENAGCWLWCLNDSQLVRWGPKCAKKIFFSLHHQQQLSDTKFWPCYLNVAAEKQKSRFISAGNVFFSIFWPILVLIAALVSCSCTMFCLLLLYPSASRFGMLCIKRCSSAYLSCNQWFFELMLSSCHLEATWPLSSDHWDQLDLFSQRTAAHWVFFLFEIILCNP